MRRFKRAIAIAFVFAVVSGVGAVVTPALSASAAPALPDSGTTGAAPSGTCKKPRLLGVFIPWYEYLDVQKDDTGACSVTDFNLLPKNGKSSDVPLVLLAIVDDLLRIAGLVAVIFVIYGGVQYATSQGSPDATAKAQSTVLYALIGLVIALVAVTFVTFLGRALT